MVVFPLIGATFILLVFIYDRRSGIAAAEATARSNAATHAFFLLFFCCECNAATIASSSELPVDAV